MYAAVRPAAARPDRPVLALPLGRHRPGDLGRPRRTTSTVLDRSRPARARSSTRSSWSSSSASSRSSLGLVAATRHPPGRRPAGSGRVAADRPVPAPGHPARRRRHHLELAAVAVRPRQPDPDGRSVSAASPAPGSATSTAALPAVGLIGVWVLLGLLHRAAADRHEQDRPGALRGGPASTAPDWLQRVPRRSPLPEPALRDRRLPHRHGHRRARRLRHRLRLDRRRPGQRHGRARASRSTSSPSSSARSAWPRRSPSCSWSSCSSSILPIQRLTREDAPMRVARARALRRPGAAARADGGHDPAVRQHLHDGAAPVGHRAAAASSGRPTRSGATSSTPSTSRTWARC